MSYVKLTSRSDYYPFPTRPRQRFIVMRATTLRDPTTGIADLSLLLGLEPFMLTSKQLKYSLRGLANSRWYCRLIPNTHLHYYVPKWWPDRHLGVDRFSFPIPSPKRRYRELPARPKYPMVEVTRSLTQVAYYLLRHRKDGVVNVAYLYRTLGPAVVSRQFQQLRAFYGFEITPANDLKGGDFRVRKLPNPVLPIEQQPGFEPKPSPVRLSRSRYARVVEEKGLDDGGPDEVMLSYEEAMAAAMGEDFGKGT